MPHNVHWYTFYTLIVIISLSIQSCKQEPDDPTFLIKQDTKDYCDFQNGTWWIYKDLSTAKLDTITVVGRSQAIGKATESSFNSEIITLKLSATAYSPLNSEKNPINYYINAYGAYDIVDWLYVTPNGYLSDELYGSGEDTTQNFSATHSFKYYTTLDTLTLNSNLFTDVKIFSGTGSITGDHIIKIYWSKHVGIIQLERIDGSLWQLINYNILQ